MPFMVHFDAIRSCALPSPCGIVRVVDRLAGGQSPTAAGWEALAVQHNVKTIRTSKENIV